MKSLSNSRQVQQFQAGEDESGQRIDNFLFYYMKGVPKTRIYKAIRGGEVRVNKKRVKPLYKLCMGDIVRIPPLFRDENRPVFVGDTVKSQVEAGILYEDSLIMVLNKPSGLAVHGGSGIKLGLIEILRDLRPECKRLSLVHRLDRETSGCIVVTKKNTVLRFLHQQLRERTMSKHYLALVRGRWPRRKSIVDVGLEKNILQSGERMVRPAIEGKPSITRVEIVKPLQGATLIKASPVTGRTHQIRVHCQYAGFPLLGDEKYASHQDEQFAKVIGLNRLFLHAWQLSFDLPEEKGRMTFEAPLPDNLDAIVRNLQMK